METTPTPTPQKPREPRETAERHAAYRRRRHLPLTVGLASIATLVGGCAGGGDDAPQTTPPPTQVSSQVAPPPPPPLPPPIREVRATGGRTKVTVIDDGGQQQKPTTLIEASRLAKAQKRQRQAQKPIAEINDENLAEFAEGADVIVLESEPAGQLPDEPLLDGTVQDSVPDGLRNEDYWRNRALELRMAWRRSVDELAELELESAALRQQFYAEDDPYIRDSQVKPSWDRVLDRMGVLREQAQRYERELDSFLDEGRREGALQGWLNQGWELEPTPEERQLVEPLSFGTQDGEPVAREPGG